MYLFVRATRNDECDVIVIKLAQWCHTRASLSLQVLSMSGLLKAACSRSPLVFGDAKIKANWFQNAETE